MQRRRRSTWKGNAGAEKSAAGGGLRKGIVDVVVGCGAPFRRAAGGVSPDNYFARAPVRLNRAGAFLLGWFASGVRL